ncbi:Glutaredoxin-related protein [hydrothermal vent metagenome]|uniref:Glutaredoxin-related protein n=1 Tax=hydrothermal vent metagenome TaxID=652676 RepID=A0A3B0WHZ0_9ZZZZ
MTDQTTQRIEQMLDESSVFLFMKGNPQTPMCGFSSNTVKILKDLIGDGFSSFNVLEDPEIREGIKAYGQWPTIPQLYVNKELVGGNDIISEMFNTGELHELLNLTQPDRTAPKISITDDALSHIKEGLKDMGDHQLFLSVDDEFNTRFSLEKPKGYEVIADVGDLKVYMDIGTAKRSDGVEISWVDELQGSGLRIKNPNEPPAVKDLSVAELQDWFATEIENPHVYDVRSVDKVEEGTVDHALRLDKAAIESIESMEKETPLVFVCQVGQSSMSAAEFFRKKGYSKVFNLTGGYNAWNE